MQKDSDGFQKQLNFNSFRSELSRRRAVPSLVRLDPQPSTLSPLSLNSQTLPCLKRSLFLSLQLLPNLNEEAYSLLPSRSQL